MEVSDRRAALTREGYENIQRELEEILTVKRPDISRRLKEAIQMGDLSENFDYEDAKRQQGILESRIAYLKDILNNSTIIECADGNGCVSIGSKVAVKDLDEKFEETFLIVGPPEADPSEGKISYESSVGSALLDRKVGETVTVETIAGEIRYEIISVE